MAMRFRYGMRVALLEDGSLGLQTLGGKLSAKGIYTALSGAMAQDQRLETIANNLANASTTGFKKDGVTFQEYVTANEKYPDSITIPRIAATTESFYDMQGGDKGYVDSKGSYSDMSQGGLKNTGNSFDIALEGKGFLEVATPSGVQMTRNGALKIDSEGKLVTADGFPVLKSGGNGGDVAGRTITLTGKNVTIGFSGEVYDGDTQVGKLSIVNVDQKDALRKVGNSLYTIKPNFNTTAHAVDDVKIHQGFLEMSNVNIVEEMTQMIQASRTFEATRNAIKAFDSMDEKLVNVVPKVTP